MSESSQRYNCSLGTESSQNRYQIQYRGHPTQRWVAGIDTFFLLYLERLGVRKLEAFFGILVGTMTVSFGVMYLMADCPTEQVVVGTILPRIRCALQPLQPFYTFE